MPELFLPSLGYTTGRNACPSPRFILLSQAQGGKDRAAAGHLGRRLKGNTQGQGHTPSFMMPSTGANPLSHSEGSIASKLTCTTSQERITAITGFPLADVFLASASARPAVRKGRLGWDTPVGTHELGHQPTSGAGVEANTRVIQMGTHQCTKHHPHTKKGAPWCQGWFLVGITCQVDSSGCQCTPDTHQRDHPELGHRGCEMPQ